MKKQIILLLGFLLPLGLMAQRPLYLDIGAGVSFSNFRDFGTSPLIYSGNPTVLSLALASRNDKSEHEFGVSYAAGTYSAVVGTQYSASKVKTWSAYYSSLFNISALSTEKWNFKVGGLFNGTGNLRINPSLQNNANGAEIFATLLASAKISRDFSRKEAKAGKFLFIKYKLKPRKKTLSFRLDLGLMNMTYRNDYAYVGISSTLNAPVLFDHYQFKVFSGYRMGTVLDYDHYFQNNNAIRLSYIWDAYMTGGELDKFEMAHHQLKVSFLVNIK